MTSYSYLIFPKTLLRWKEPFEIRRKLAQSELNLGLKFISASVATLVFIGVSGFFLTLGLSFELLGRSVLDFLTVSVLSFGAGLFLSSLMFFVDRLFPRTVRVLGNQILIEPLGGHKYKDIEAFQISSVKLDGEEIPVLTIFLRKKVKFAYVIHPKVDLGRLKKILGERCRPRLANSSTES